ncbi:S8 family serine peptidase [Aquipseudomonas guryensis]|uniref:S8 family serine peptidase n=1 Tax=Aquipseudomonas guryensis TaxID=2759165 RepID=A0A7W4DAL3_9GAMM|nr:S8 family serine peptidase [Pseudomonas guryensis]MBB1518767.1 S8 family serine peptidase [Pseudomonas guryensis]
MRQPWLLLALVLSLPLQAASDAAGGPASSGVPGGPPASSAPPAPGGPAPTSAPAPVVPAATPTAPAAMPAPALIPPAPPSVPAGIPIPPPRRATGSLLDQPMLQAPPQQWRGVVQPPAQELPALREWLVFSRDLAEAEQQRLALQAFQLSILRRQQLPNLQRVLSVYRIPAQLDLEQLEADLRRQFPHWQQELNQRYRPLQLPDAAELQQRNWGQRAMGRQQPAAVDCGKGKLLAMLDGPVNSALSEFAGADLHYQSLPPAQYLARSSEAARHGTALAALLVGREQVAGLLPGARLQALGVFGEDRTAGLHTRSDWVIAALEQLAGLQPAPQAVNLSFGGSHSRLLAELFEQLAARMDFVAAAGNDGQAGVRYPAAYPGVLAVGAVDARLRRLRQSNFGRHLALVAPGEDIWTLDGNGQGFYASGTSFAAPFVSAALALAPSAEALLAQARDLGENGRDEQYGAGLARLPGCR